MLSHECPTCFHVFSRKNDLTRHLAKKKLCTPPEEGPDGFTCDICGDHLQHASSLSRHKKFCVRTTVKTLKEKVDALQYQIEESHTAIPPIHTTTQQEFKEIEDALLNRIKDLEERNENLENGILVPIASKWEIQPLNLASFKDLAKNQVYFGLPGPKLVPLEDIPTDAILVKFGQSDDFYKRQKTHDKDFGGFTLLDSVLTNNPKHVEKKFKECLSIKRRLIKAKTERKETNDTECFFVRNQEEYEEIVRTAVEFAETYRKEVEEADTKNKILNEILKEDNLENLQLKLELMRMQHATT